MTKELEENWEKIIDELATSNLYDSLMAVEIEDNYENILEKVDKRHLKMIAEFCMLRLDGFDWNDVIRETR